MASTGSAKQETLIYALAAAGVVIVILLGTILFLVSSRQAVPAVSDIPLQPGATGEQAPALSPEQIEGSGGALPPGHTPVPGAPAPGAAPEEGASPEAGTVPEGAEEPAPESAPAE